MIELYCFYKISGDTTVHGSGTQVLLLNDNRSCCAICNVRYRIDVVFPDIFELSISSYQSSFCMSIVQFGVIQILQ